jgi:hypothetical protein
VPAIRKETVTPAMPAARTARGRLRTATTAMGVTAAARNTHGNGSN